MNSNNDGIDGINSVHDDDNNNSNSKDGSYLLSPAVVLPPFQRTLLSCDNNNALILKNHLKNTTDNRELYEMLLERSLGIPDNSLHITALKDYYWPIGTHYYKPLNKELYKTREEFIYKVQNPEKGILVVGEAVSHNQGWTEGALESVKSVLTKKWIETIC
jgi:hypothetical protein